MLLDGESGGPYHQWQLTTRVLKKELDETGIFQVDVVTAPPADASFSAFKPDFPKYQVDRAQLRCARRAVAGRFEDAPSSAMSPTAAGSSSSTPPTTRSPAGKRSTT